MDLSLWLRVMQSISGFQLFLCELDILRAATELGSNLAVK